MVVVVVAEAEAAVAEIVVEVVKIVVEVDEVRPVLAVNQRRRGKGHLKISIKRVEGTITEREVMTRKWLEGWDQRRERPTEFL